MAKELSQITDSDIAENFEKIRKNYSLYAKLNLKIKDKQGEVVPFVFNRVQRILWNTFLQDRNSGKLFRWYIVKSRQLGSTTWVLGLLYWLTTTSSTKNALVVAHQEGAAFAMGEKVQSMHLKTRPILRPSTRKMNRAEIHFANSLETAEKTGDIGLDSHIDVATADSKALGRSYTYQYALLTEFGIWPELGIDVADRMGALNAAIPKLPESVIIIETTAKGDNYAKDVWDDPDNGYRKIFISWLADDEYRHELAFENYFELSEDREHKYGDEVEESENIKLELAKWYPDESKSVLWLEHECMCRLSWRRTTIDSDFNGDRYKFKQEYPTTVQDAFTSSADGVFKYQRLAEMESEITLNNLNFNRFRYQHDKEEKRLDRKFYAAKHGHLHVYENPVAGATYVIGGDAAQGIQNGDDSSLVVLRLPSLVEVACFSDIIIPDEFAGIANYLGMLYNKALVGIEVNDKGGYSAVEKLQNEYFYPNLYYYSNPLDRARVGVVRYGWVTNAITRGIMISDLSELIDNNHIHINSKEIIKQLKTFVKGKDGKIAAAPGKHDDLVMALMIAVQMGRNIHLQKRMEVTKAPKNSPDYLIKQIEKKRRVMGGAYR